ncbi:DMT family transporter [Marinobacterium weihaiense]|uniref:DMT family transporter n=1 Tax=Marinobacterium weihaiense TaxID=2851016 RepID=A0ABS6MAL1_9GAMM|nr:DMT family transporter [Marinobacterium weihaiense]MBV0933210.1 DMT family transporter [Marinobacterium weihaiense]
MHQASKGAGSAPFLFMAVASAVLMGTIGVISNYAGLSAETLTFYRLGFGAALMLGYLLLAGQARLLLTWPSWRVLANGVLLAAFIVCYVQAMLYTSMANAIMMVYLSPVAASVVAHFLLGERLGLAAVGLILLALFGFAMMMEFRLSFASAADATGMAFAALAMLAYAGFILMNRIMPARVHAYTRCWYQLLAGALCLLPLMLQQGESIAAPQWGWLLLAGLLPGFLAILFAVIALRELPAATFGTLAYMEPIAVVTFGWVLFDQALTPLQLSGCALIMASGMAQALLSQRRERRGRTALAAQT